MELKKHSSGNLLLWLIWFTEGVFVGFGAILPGISGGALCAAFGMYRPIIETISDIKEGLKKYGIMLGVFFLGIAVGFIGLSGIAAILLERNPVLVTYAFIGFIIGTLPELYKEAGTEGRSKYSFIPMVIAFTVMVSVLVLFKTKPALTIAPGILGYIICGVLWGLSFIIPGLSSSSLLLFFGLYQPMLEGISKLDMQILIPLGAGAGVCVLLLSRAVGLAYRKHFSVISHGVIGIVSATVVMIIPSGSSILISAFGFIFILCGAAVSYFFTRACGKLKSRAE